MNKHYNRFRRLAAWLLGIVFLISGILKLMDPTGNEMMMRSYYSFMHLGWLNWSAKAVGTAFALIEALVGIMLVCGIWRKVTGIIASSLTGFFTLLTLVLVIFNPTMDCGCFGEIVHLTHLQTFIKNLVLCVLCVIAFTPMRDLGQAKKIKYVSAAICACSILAFMCYSLLMLPLKEFTDFKTGAIIAAAAPATDEESFTSVFVYEKDGERQVFTLENLPDETWSFVETKTEAIDDGFSGNPVFSLTDEDGEYCDSLVAQGQVLVLSLYKKASERKMEHLNDFISAAEAEGIRTVFVSAEDDTPYHSDFKTLATLNRSNGGATLLTNGMITAKWSYLSMAARGNSVKAIEKYQKAAAANADELAAERQSRGSLMLQGFLLYVFAVLLLL